MAIEKISVICIRSLVVTVYDYMFQSSSRKDFSDILLDPTALAVLGSIALHAILAANLAFFTQVPKEVKKPAPDTVKVVELTPAELQRIPQAPQSKVPTPSQQVLPPVYQPTTPVPPTNTPTPETIPVSPNVITPPPQAVRKTKIVLKTPAPTPSQPKVIDKSAGNKDQKATKQIEPAPLQDFNSGITVNPTPTPTPAPTTSKIVRKDPPPANPPKKKSEDSNPKKRRGNNDEIVEGKRNDILDPPIKIGQERTGIQKDKPNNSPPSKSSNESSGDGKGNGFYGDYTVRAAAELEKWKAKYPNLKIYPPKSLKAAYPKDTTCPKFKQPPFIIYSAIFGQVPENQGNPVDPTSSDVLETSIFGEEDTPEKKVWAIKAKSKALEEANEAEKIRPPADKGKQVVYQYRVELDPTTCNKK